MTRFAATNPAFESAVRESFARQTFMTTLGAALELVEPGRVQIGLAAAPSLCQQNGFLHAGVLTSIADSACGYAALSLAPPGHDVLSVEFKINLLKPASAPRFVACGEVLRAGRTLTVATGEVFGVGPSGRELVAAMLSTIITRAAIRDTLAGVGDPGTA